MAIDLHTNLGAVSTDPLGALADGAGGAPSRRPHPGSGGPPRDEVNEIQRARMIAATLEILTERSARTVTVAQVVGRAGVSRKTFYEIFTDCERCVLAALETTVAQLAGAVVPAYERGSCWRERIRGGLTALLEFFDEHPFTARMCLIETFGGGPRMLAYHTRALDLVARVLDEGRTHAPASRRISSVTAQGLAGAIFSVLHTRALEGSGAPLSELLNPLMSMIVLPFLGPRAAHSELEHTVAPGSASPCERPPLLDNPLDGLEMRLTYRTLRVLRAIELTPGSSNRQIGEVAGILDQGQVSKLLKRLQRLDLVRNAGTHADKGAPNDWYLTTRANRLLAALEGPGTPYAQ